MENTEKKKSSTKATTKKTGSTKPATKKTSTKTTTKKTETKTTTKVAKETKKTTTKAEPKTTKKTTKEAKPASKKATTKKVETKVEAKPAKKPAAKKSTKAPAKKAEVKVVEEVVEVKEVKPAKVVKEEVKEEVVKNNLTKRTLIITAICTVLLIICMIAIRFTDTYTYEENNYYVYSKDSSLILWNQSTNEKIELTKNFVTNKESTVNYSYNEFYTIKDEKVYFIENITETTFDLCSVELSKVFTNPEAKVVIASGLTDYKVTDKGLFYVKDDALIYNDFAQEQTIVEKIVGKAITDSGNFVYYQTEELELFSYDTKTKAAKKLTDNFTGEFFTVDDEIVYIVSEGNLNTAYNSKGKIDSNITQYGEGDNSFIYYKISQEKLDGFKDAMANAEKSKLTIEKFKEIMKNSETVLFYLGKPDCSYCEQLDNVFTEIKKEKEFTYVYVNTSITDSEVMTEILKVANLDASEFGTPTLVVTKNNKVVKTNTGYMDKEASTKFLTEAGVFASKFQYENPPKSSYTDDLLFLNSDTYIYEDGKNRLFTKGLLYAADLKDISKNDYQLSFSVDPKFDYKNASSTGTYYNLYLNITRTKSGRSIETDIVYTDLQFLNYDNHLNNIYYQTDGKVIRASIALTGLKTKDEFDNICSYDAGAKGTLIVVNCDSNYAGELYQVTSINNNKIADSAVQAYVAGKATYYIKYENEAYTIYNADSKQLDKDLYYPIAHEDDLFYMKQNKILGEKEEDTVYTYDLFIAGEDAVIELDKNVDVNMGIFAIDEKK